MLARKPATTSVALRVGVRGKSLILAIILAHLVSCAIPPDARDLVAM